LLRFWCSFSFCHWSQFLRISEGCFHRHISHDCCTSFVCSSVCF
jgi:hypothetical protein